MAKQSIHKLAVVTGASSGIGLELAKVFAREGYDLVIASSSMRIHEAAVTLRELGHTVTDIQTDLSSTDGVKKLYDGIKALGRSIDAVAINAGIGVGGEFAKTDFDDEFKMMNLNMVGLVQLTKLIMPDLLAQRSGRILFTSSVAGTMPGPYYAVYAATKAFVQSFAEAIRHELKDTGITITALQPGATETNFFARANMLDTPAGKMKKDDAATVAQQGFDALMAGADHVVGGNFMNKIQTKVANVVTGPHGAALQGSQTKPSQH